MDGAGILQLIGAILGAGGVVAIIQGIFGRKKMSADVVKTINEAAGGIVERVERDNARLREENEKLKERVDAAEEKADIAEWRASRLSTVVLDYVSYVGRQSDEIRKLGGSIPDPPEVPVDLLSESQVRG